MTDDLFKYANEFVKIPTTFIADKDSITLLPTSNKKTIYISGFQLDNKYQREDIIVMLFRYLTENFDVVYYAVDSIFIGMLLLTTKFSGQYFTNIGSGEYCWSKNGKLKNHISYNSIKSEEIRKTLSPLRKVGDEWDEASFDEAVTPKLYGLLN